MAEYGYFLPIKHGSRFKLPTVLMKKQGIGARREMPFISLSDTDNTVKRFVEALSKSMFDDAKAYISKNFINDFNFDEMSLYFNSENNYKTLIKAEFSERPKNCVTNSILVLNDDSRNSILHVYLIKEPDGFGNWKICGIEKE
ncbi:MAG: hypothetical protein LBL35_08180 [Clostridiales bacterium]|nr:hypothetical protein [Clostridiales bacterium]